ncbi:MAG: TetR/AcrR family transcriptional regulator [Yoonia sp.]|uniref:TetR/AcrR family transcriptional regulator n=1 Tax=Yoonia sp. TaxID=2212373 RepID=UPI003EF1B80E
MPPEDTKNQILKIAREVLASEGLAAVSFDAIAGRMGRSKQTVLYWYASKQELIAALFLPWLEAEADIAIMSVTDASGRDEAIAAFVRAIMTYHLKDLDRFRMMYLLPQTIRPASTDPLNAKLLEKVHPITGRMYGALAAKLEGTDTSVRQQAFAIHSAALGQVLMIGLADSTRDPLLHSAAELTETLVSSLASR